MMSAKKLGIWMDHSNACIIEITTNPIQTIIIESKFTHEEKEHSLNKNENLMHNKEQHQQSEYYKRISEVIRNYEDVLLFGPTTAKSELANLLKADHNYEKITVIVKSAGNLTENQQHAFVREYFSKR